MPDELTRLAEDVLRARQGGNGRQPPLNPPPMGGDRGGPEDPLDFIAAQRVRAELFGRHDISVADIRAAMEARAPLSRENVTPVAEVPTPGAPPAQPIRAPGPAEGALSGDGGGIQGGPLPPQRWDGFEAVAGPPDVPDLLRPTEPPLPQDPAAMARETAAEAPPVVRHDPNLPQPAEIDAEGMATINAQRGELLERRNEEIKRLRTATTPPVPTEPVSAGGQRLSEVVEPTMVERLLHPIKQRIRTLWGTKTLIGEVQAGKMVNAIVEAELQYRIKSGLYNRDELSVQPFEDWLRGKHPRFADELAADPVWQQFFGTQFVDAERLRANIHSELMGGLPMYAPSNEEPQEQLYRKLTELAPDELPPARGILEKIVQFGGELGPFLAEFAVLRRAVRPVGRRLARPPRRAGEIAGRQAAPPPPGVGAGEAVLGEAVTGAMAAGGLAAVQGEDPGLAAATFGALPGVHGAARFLAPGVRAGLARGVGTGVVFGGTTRLAGGDWDDVLISGVVAPLLFHVGDIVRFPFRPRALAVKGRPFEPEAWRKWGDPEASKVKRMLHSFMTWQEQVAQGRSDTIFKEPGELQDLGSAIQREAGRARRYPGRYTTEDRAVLEDFARRYDPQQVLRRQGVGGRREGEPRAPANGDDVRRGVPEVPAGDVRLSGRPGAVAARVPEEKPRAPVVPGFRQPEKRLRRPFQGPRYVVNKIQDAPPAWEVRDQALDEVLQTLANQEVAQSVRQEYQNIEDMQDRGDVERQRPPQVHRPGPELPGAPPRVEIPEGRKSVRVAPVGNLPGYTISRMPGGSHFVRFKGKAPDVVKQRLGAAGIRWEPKPNVRAWISPARYDAGMISDVVHGRVGQPPPESPPFGGELGGARPTERDVPFASNEVPADRPGPGGLRGLTPDDVDLLLGMPEKDTRGFVTAALIRRGYRHRTPSTKYEYLVHPSGDWRYRLQRPNLRREILRDDVWTPVRERPITYKTLADEIRKRLRTIAPPSPPEGGRVTPPEEARAQPRAQVVTPAPTPAPPPAEVTTPAAGVSAAPPPAALVSRETVTPPVDLPASLKSILVPLGRPLPDEVRQSLADRAAEQQMERGLVATAADARRELHTVASMDASATQLFGDAERLHDELQKPDLSEHDRTSINRVLDNNFDEQEALRENFGDARLDFQASITAMRRMGPEGLAEVRKLYADATEIARIERGRLAGEIPYEVDYRPFGLEEQPVDPERPFEVVEHDTLRILGSFADRASAEARSKAEPNGGVLVTFVRGPAPKVLPERTLRPEEPRVVPVATVGGPADKRIGKMREQADKVQALIDVAKALPRAEFQEEQSAIRAMADAIEAGELPALLDPITSKAFLTDLLILPRPPTRAGVAATRRWRKALPGFRAIHPEGTEDQLWRQIQTTVRELIQKPTGGAAPAVPSPPAPSTADAVAAPPPPSPPRGEEGGLLTLGQALDKAVEQAKTEVRAAAGLPAITPPSKPAPPGPAAKEAKKAPPLIPPTGGELGGPGAPTWRITYVNRAFAPRASHATIQGPESADAARDKWLRTINKKVLEPGAPVTVERVEPPPESPPLGGELGGALAPDASKLAKAQQEPVNAQTAKIRPRTASEITAIEEAARETDNPDVALDVPAATPDRLAGQQAARQAEQDATRSKLAAEAEKAAGAFKDVDFSQNDPGTMALARKALADLAKTGIAKNTDPALFPPQKDITTYVRVRDQAEGALRRTSVEIPVPNYPRAKFYSSAKTEKQVRALAAKAGRMKPRKITPFVAGTPPTPIRAPGELAVRTVRATPSFPMPKPHERSPVAWLDGLRRAVSGPVEPKQYRTDSVMIIDSEAVTIDQRRMWIQRGDFSKLTQGGPTLYGFGGSQGKSTIHVVAKGMAGSPGKGFSGRKGLDPFPAYQQIVPEISQHRFPIAIDYTIGNLRQALAFADADHRAVAIVRNPDDTVGFMSVTPEVGEAEINIQAGGSVLGNVNGDFLVEQLQWHWRDGDTSVSFDFAQADKPLRTDGNSTTGVLMPVSSGPATVKAQKLVVPGLYPKDIAESWSKSYASPRAAQKAGLTPAFLHGEKGEVYTSEAGETHNLSALPKAYQIEGSPAYDPIITLGFQRANGDFLPFEDAWMDIVPTLPIDEIKGKAGLPTYSEADETHRKALADALKVIDLFESIEAMPGASPERIEADRQARDSAILELKSAIPGSLVQIPPTRQNVVALRTLHLKGAREQVEQLRKEGKLGKPTPPDPQHQEFTTDELAYIRSLSPEKPAFGIGAMSDIPDLRNWWQRVWDSTADRMIFAPPGTIRQGIFTAIGRGVSHFYGLSEREKRAFRRIRGAGNLALDSTNTVLALVKAEVAAAAAGRLEEVKRIRRKLEKPEPEKLGDEDLAAVQSRVHRRLEDVIRGVRTSVERGPEGEQLGPIQYTAVYPTTEAERRIFNAYSDLATPMTDEILNNEWMWPYLSAFGLKNIKDIIALKRTGPGAYLRRLYTSKTGAAEVQAPRGPEQRGRLLPMSFTIRTTAPRIRGGMWMPRRGDEALFTVLDMTGSGLPVIHQFFDEVQANNHFLELHKIRGREFGESAAGKIKLLDPFSVDDLEALGVLEPIRNVEILISRSLVDQALNVETLKQFKMLADTVAVKDVLDPANKLGYVQIPNVPSFGPLAKMWVPESLAYQLNRFEIVRHGFWSKFWHTWNYAFKFSKVVLSPSTWSRQLQGNMLFMLADGMNVITDAKWLHVAAQEFKNKGRNYQLAVHEGIISGTFFASERRDFHQMIAHNPTDFTLGVQQWIEAQPQVRKLQRKAGDAAAVLGRLYDLPEQVMKLASYLKKTQGRGMSHEEATRLVQNRYPNYDEPGAAARWSRRSILGAPFVMFTDQAAKIGARHMRDHPARMMAILSLPGLLALASHWMLQMTDEEAELLNQDPRRRSWWARYFQPWLPWRDSEGKPGFWDLRWIWPLASDADFVLPSGGLSIPFVLQQPFFTVAEEIKFNRDDFLGREVVPRDDPGALRVWKFALHAAKAAVTGPAPPLIHKRGGGSAERIWKAAMGEAQEGVSRAILREVFGVSARDPWIPRARAYKLIKETLSQGDADKFAELMVLYNEVYRGEFDKLILPGPVIESMLQDKIKALLPDRRRR